MIDLLGIEPKMLRGSRPPSIPPHGEQPAPTARSPPRFPSAAISATSRPPWSDNAASIPANRNTPTAPDVSSFSTPARIPPQSKRGLITTVAYQRAGAARAICAGRIGRGRRLARAMASRQHENDRQLGGDRTPRRRRSRQRRDLYRSRLLRIVRPILAKRRPRNHRRPDRIHQSPSHRPRRPGSRRVPDPRCGGCDDRRFQRRPRGDESRRRHDRQQLADAIPGGCSGRSGHPQQSPRNHRPGRGVRRRIGRRILADFDDLRSKWRADQKWDPG